MTEEQSKAHATAMLEAADYAVESILPVDGARRADLIARHGTDVLIVEAKGKAPHQGFLALVDTARRVGLAECIRTEQGWSALSRIIEYADSQLRDTPSDASAVRILWVSALHDDWQFVCEGFRHRLHGVVELSVFRPTARAPEFVGTRPCFYYDASDFARYPNIDAAILASPAGAQLLVNEFGEGVAQLRGTRLYTEMNALGAVVDPTVLCAEDHALAIRTSGLKATEDKWAYLKATYGVLTSVMRCAHFKAMLSVQLNELTSPNKDAV